MDPDTTLQEIFYRLAAGEWKECFRSCLELKMWLAKGGFAPKGHIIKFSREDTECFLLLVMDQCKRRLGEKTNAT